MTSALPRTSLLGTTALLFEAPGETSLETQRRIWALAREAERMVDQYLAGLGTRPQRAAGAGARARRGAAARQT